MEAVAERILAVERPHPVRVAIDPRRNAQLVVDNRDVANPRIIESSASRIPKTPP